MVAARPGGYADHGGGKMTTDHQLPKRARRSMMKKLLVSLVITLLLLLPLAAAYAEAPTPVSGTFARVGPVRNRVVVEVGGNTIVTSEITQAWSGDISGIGQAHRRQINHPNGEFTTVINTT